jgi:hypothetical protein
VLCKKIGNKYVDGISGNHYDSTVFAEFNDCTEFSPANENWAHMKEFVLGSFIKPH